MLKYRKIESIDDERIADIIRTNLKKHHLDIPGTAYFDPELDHLSIYYNSNPSKRIYFITLNEMNEVIGGVGVAEFEAIENGAELQKLYLDDSAKGKGYGKQLIQVAEKWAKSVGYQYLYLETHTNLSTAMIYMKKWVFCK